MWKSRIICLVALALAAPLAAEPVAAAELNPDDNGDNALLRAFSCVQNQKAVAYSAESTARCDRVYSVLTDEVRTGTTLSAAHRNKYQVARVLAVSAVMGGYLKQDGKYTRRSCLRIPDLESAVAAYRLGMTSEYDDFHATHKEMLRSMAGKCRN